MTMENMSELPADQQISDSSGSATSQRPDSPGEPDYASPADEELEPTISRAEAIPVSISSMIDAGEFRSQMGDVTYHTLNGRMSPSYCTSPNNYATLTPLQPLPPISTVSEKFGGHVGGSPNVSSGFTLMPQNMNTPGAVMDMTTYGHRYHDKLSMGAAMNMGPTLGATAMTMMSTNTNYQQSPLSYGYAQNGLIKSEHKMGSPTFESYSSSPMRLPVDHPGSPLHSPNPMTPMMVPVNGLIHNAPTPSPHSESPLRDRPSTSLDMQKAQQQEVEEINTKELAQRISSELKRYSIPQAVFAQRVLCRSQGTLSDLLRNPKPWSKLKSGRETFRRMWKWLQEPEFQRMSALRLAGNASFWLLSVSMDYITRSVHAVGPLLSVVGFRTGVNVSSETVTVFYFWLFFFSLVYFVTVFKGEFVSSAFMRLFFFYCDYLIFCRLQVNFFNFLKFLFHSHLGFILQFLFPCISVRIGSVY